MTSDFEKRMDFDPEGIEIVSTPQCVECKYNLGRMACEQLNMKPPIFLNNEEECPLMEKEIPEKTI